MGDPEQTSAGGVGEEGDGEPDPYAGIEDVKAPWHFKLLVVATVVYLGWRLVQMVTEVAS